MSKSFCADCDLSAVAVGDGGRWPWAMAVAVGDAPIQRGPVCVRTQDPLFVIKHGFLLALRTHDPLFAPKPGFLQQKAGDNGSMVR